MPSDITASLVVVLALCLTASFLAFLMSYAHSTRLLEFLIGSTAGLESLQLAHVHIFTMICVLYAVFGARSTRRRSGPASYLIIAIGTLIVSVPLGTLVNSKTLALQLVALAGSATIIGLRATPESLTRMGYGLLATCTVGAAVALGQDTGLVPYTPFTDPNQLGRVKGIWHEPDWLGFFCACGILLAFRLDLRDRRQALVVAVLAAGLTISLARAAWGALGLVAVLGYFTARTGYFAASRRTQNRRVLLLATLLAAVFVALSPGLRNNISARIAAVTGPQAQQDISVRARAAQRAALRTLENTAPWHGYGLSAAGRVTVNGSIDYGVAHNNVASNWILGWWVDGKWLAVPLILALVLLAACTLRTTAGLLLTLILFNSLYSNVIMLPVAWLAVGMAMASLPHPLFGQLDGHWPLRASRDPERPRG
jgi:hypothetical protein